MMDRELAALTTELERQSFSLRRGSNGHFAVYAPDGAFAASLASTPSDVRARKNNLAKLRRAGFRVPGRSDRIAKGKRS